MNNNILSTIKDPSIKEDKNRLSYNQVLALLGYKFYRIKDGEIETIRVVSIKNQDRVKIIKNDDYENTLLVDPNGIVNNFTKLASDGLITFNIVKLHVNKLTVDDIIVCLYKSSTMKNNIQEPDVVCRQNISDLYYNYQRTNIEKEMVGMCMTKATCPANLDYMIMTACDGVEYSTGINIYIEDNIDTILSMIPKKKINKVLSNGLEQHLTRFNILSIDNGSIKSHNGYCRNIDQLLKENNFQYDFDTVFDIIGLGLDLNDYMVSVKDEIDEEYYTLKNDIVNELNKIFRINITNTVVIEYDHDIDLLELKDIKYILIRDINNKLFIVNYTENGEFRESDLSVIAAKQAISKVSLLFNRDKYKEEINNENNNIL